MVEEQRGAALLAEQGAGVAVGALGAFFQHHPKLGAGDLIAQHKVRHAVRFHLHHE